MVCTAQRYSSTGGAEASSASLICFNCQGQGQTRKLETDKKRNSFPINRQKHWHQIMPLIISAVILAVYLELSKGEYDCIVKNKGI